MGRKIVETNHPNLSWIEIHGELTYEDMTCEEELGLTTGKPMWVLLDVSDMTITLPEHFLDSSRKSFFLSENLQHMAIYCRSSLLRNVALMIAKLTRRGTKLSVYDTAEKAEGHLRTLIEKSGIR